MKKLVALITGSSRGIGKSIAIEFAKANVNVVINYKENEREAIKLTEHIKDTYKVDAIALKCDVSKEDEVYEMVNKITDWWYRYIS